MRFYVDKYILLKIYLGESVLNFRSLNLAGTDNLHNISWREDNTDYHDTTKRQPQQCTLGERRNAAEKICARQRSVTKLNSSAVFPALFFNNENKMIFCSINKAGSTSAHNYFHHLNDLNKETRGVGRGKYIRYKPGFKHPQKGYYFLTRVPVDIVLRNFSQYKKFILVRHPLQRFIAAYYEAREQKYMYNHTANLTEFVTKQLFTDRIDFHWLDYQRWCFPGQMHYDYIFKLETMESDNVKLNRLLRTKSNATYRKSHVNSNVTLTDSYKYDKVLQDFEFTHSTLFQRVLKKYSADMEMFGYIWKNGSSGCRYNPAGCC